ncbi:uncharacterized protein LOC112341912 [Selaginella moellendorffii]|uniref:uncharacterized protein LOC112341912 n=1 Tax=Selaginella moellendorffii TaxID=88036 RepID=UPI000D1C56A1|nr:uncharacterized protein LOC112341912 [Selaginella moellendorffii]|eukprot:XP_024518680.1 uncharacterized protein LOC112341912 [Selaginella moellendorffii]
MADGGSSDRHKRRGRAKKAKADPTSPRPGTLDAFLRPRVSSARVESDAVVASPGVDSNGGSSPNASQAEVKTRDSLESTQMEDGAKKATSPLRPRVSPTQGESDPSPGIEGSSPNASQAEVKIRDSMESTQIDSVGNENAMENGFYPLWSTRLRKRKSNVVDAEEPVNTEEPVDSKEPDEPISSPPVRASKKRHKKKKSRAKTRKEEIVDRDSLLCAYDLRKEARMATEEFNLLSAGKPLHPFFQRNKKQERSEDSPIKRGSFWDPCLPFHVLQDTMNVDADINWNSFQRSCFVTSASQVTSSDDHDHGYLISKDQKLAPSQRFLSDAATLDESLEKVHDFLKESGHKHLSVASLKEKYAWYLARNTDGVTTTANPSWTCLYQPHSSKQLCGNRDSVSSLSEWLSRWKQKILSRKQASLDSDRDSDGDYEIEDEDLRDGLQNTVLVTGPVGCGKSAAVYACAREHGFNVIEINSSDSRAGATIKKRFGEATQSEAVICSDQDGRKPTIILFEEIDTVFEEDKGFLAAIGQLAKSSKRPMVLTSNRRQPLLPRMRKTVIDFIKPTMDDLLVHACLVCASNGLFGEPWIMKRIVGSCHQDLRKLMMLLQFWGQGALPPSAALEADQSSTMKRNSHERRILLPRAAWWEDSDAEYCLLPELVPLSFPCSQSYLVAGKLSEAVQKAEKIATLHAAKAAEEDESLRAARRSKSSKRLAKKVEAELLDTMVVEAEGKHCGPAAMIKTCGAGRRKRPRKTTKRLEWKEARNNTGFIKDLAEEAEGLIYCTTCATEESVTEEFPSSSNEPVHPVRAQWLDMRKGQSSLLRSNSKSVQTMLSVNDALAAAAEAFSSCDMLSRMEESPCSEISQQLTRCNLYHLLQECDEAMQLACQSDAACDGRRSLPWHEENFNKLQTQKYLQEQLFLASPEKVRHGMSSDSFVDHVSYMARIVALEEHQRAELVGPRLKRSRGGYLSDKGVSTEGIQALRQHFSFRY